MQHKIIIRTILIATTFLVSVNGWALEGERNWGMSPYLGLYNPSLKLLNEGEFVAPYEGTATLVDIFGSNNNVTVPLHVSHAGYLVPLRSVRR